MAAAAAAPAPTAAPAAPGAGSARLPSAQQWQRQPPAGSGAAEQVDEDAARDYTRVPQEMDRQFEALDTDGALRPTIISPGDLWHRRSQKALLARPGDAVLDSDEQKRERDAAFDLLDALTKSGALPVAALLEGSQLSRVRGSCPALFVEDGEVSPAGR